MHTAATALSLRRPAQENQKTHTAITAAAKKAQPRHLGRQEGAVCSNQQLGKHQTTPQNRPSGGWAACKGDVCRGHPQETQHPTPTPAVRAVRRQTAAIGPAQKGAGRHQQGRTQPAGSSATLAAATLNCWPSQKSVQCHPALLKGPTGGGSGRPLLTGGGV